MTKKNMSDLIEEYLKKIIEEEGQIVIQRNKIADQFNCVPSQINYVIDTRFTIQHGYTVESKRGGGGYIRIIEIQLNQNDEVLEQMKEIIGEQVSEKKAKIIIQTLYAEEWLTKREAQMAIAAIKQENYSGNITLDNKLRAKVLLAMIELLIVKND